MLNKEVSDDPNSTFGIAVTEGVSNLLKSERLEFLGMGPTPGEAMYMYYHDGEFGLKALLFLSVKGEEAGEHEPKVASRLRSAELEIWSTECTNGESRITKLRKIFLMRKKESCEENNFSLSDFEVRRENMPNYNYKPLKTRREDMHFAEFN